MALSTAKRAHYHRCNKEGNSEFTVDTSKQLYCNSKGAN